MATSGGTNCHAGTWLIRARMGWPQVDRMHADRRGARGAASDTGGLMPDLAINERRLAGRDRVAGDGAAIGPCSTRKRQRSCFPAPVRKYSGMIGSSIFGLLLL